MDPASPRLAQIEPPQVPVRQATNGVESSRFAPLFRLFKRFIGSAHAERISTDVDPNAEHAKFLSACLGLLIQYVELSKQSGSFWHLTWQNEELQLVQVQEASNVGQENLKTFLALQKGRTGDKLIAFAKALLSDQGKLKKIFPQANEEQLILVLKLLEPLQKRVELLLQSAASIIRYGENGIDLAIRDEGGFTYLEQVGQGSGDIAQVSNFLQGEPGGEFLRDLFLYMNVVEQRSRDQVSSKLTQGLQKIHANARELSVEEASVSSALDLEDGFSIVGFDDSSSDVFPEIIIGPHGIEERYVGVEGSVDRRVQSRVISLVDSSVSTELSGKDSSSLTAFITYLSNPSQYVLVLNEENEEKFLEVRNITDEDLIRWQKASKQLHPFGDVSAIQEDLIPILFRIDHAFRAAEISNPRRKEEFFRFLLEAYVQDILKSKTDFALLLSEKIQELGFWKALEQVAAVNRIEREFSLFAFLASHLDFKRIQTEEQLKVATHTKNALATLGKLPVAIESGLDLSPRALQSREILTVEKKGLRNVVTVSSMMASLRDLWLTIQRYFGHVPSDTDKTVDFLLSTEGKEQIQALAWDLNRRREIKNLLEEKYGDKSWQGQGNLPAFLSLIGTVESRNTSLFISGTSEEELVENLKRQLSENAFAILDRYRPVSQTWSEFFLETYQENEIAVYGRILFGLQRILSQLGEKNPRKVELELQMFEVATSHGTLLQDFISLASVQQQRYVYPVLIHIIKTHNAHVKSLAGQTEQQALLEHLQQATKRMSAKLENTQRNLEKARIQGYLLSSALGKHQVEVSDYLKKNPSLVFELLDQTTDIKLRKILLKNLGGILNPEAYTQEGVKTSIKAVRMLSWLMSDFEDRRLEGYIKIILNADSLESMRSIIKDLENMESFLEKEKILGYLVGSSFHKHKEEIARYIEKDPYFVLRLLVEQRGAENPESKIRGLLPKLNTVLDAVKARFADGDAASWLGVVNELHRWAPRLNIKQINSILYRLEQVLSLEKGKEAPTVEDVLNLFKKYEQEIEEKKITGYLFGSSLDEKKRHEINLYAGKHPIEIMNLAINLFKTETNTTKLRYLFANLQDVVELIKIDTSNQEYSNPMTLLKKAIALAPRLSDSEVREIAKIITSENLDTAIKQLETCETVFALGDVFTTRDLSKVDIRKKTEYKEKIGRNYQVVWSKFDDLFSKPVSAKAAILAWKNFQNLAMEMDNPNEEMLLQLQANLAANVTYAVLTDKHLQLNSEERGIVKELVAVTNVAGRFFAFLPEVEKMQSGVMKQIETNLELLRRQEGEFKKRKTTTRVALGSLEELHNSVRGYTPREFSVV